MNNKTIFEKQQELFQNFIEDIRDIFELKIRDGVKTTFTENSIIFDDLVEVITTPDHLIPIFKFHKQIERPSEITVCKNVLNNTSEITQLFREYLLLRSHLGNFTDLGTSNDEMYNQLKTEIDYLQTLETAYFDGHKFFITKDDEFMYFLVVHKFGNAKKTIVDMGYLAKNIKTGETIYTQEYKIPKHEFSGDLAYQISTQKCTHFSN